MEIIKNLIKSTFSLHLNINFGKKMLFGGRDSVLIPFGLHRS